MPIIYGVIARGSIVLCEHMDGKGNAKEIVRTILTKIPSNDSQMSYIYEEFGLLLLHSKLNIIIYISI